MISRLFIALFAPVVLAACTPGDTEDVRTMIPGDPARGAWLIRQYGCGSCHVIPGIGSADGLVGPPLYFWARRTYIAGQVPNTPQNLVRWIQNPPAIEPGTAMPDLGVTEQQAIDIAAYLYTLR